MTKESSSPVNTKVYEIYWYFVQYSPTTDCAHPDLTGKNLKIPLYAVIKKRAHPWIAVSEIENTTIAKAWQTGHCLTEKQDEDGPFGKLGVVSVEAVPVYDIVKARYTVKCKLF
jgi:hypothetical protein